MKIRNGFVSNSSSSSFVIVGTTIDRDDTTTLQKICENHLEITEKMKNDYSEKICCGKQLRSKFCPVCGKNSDDVEGTLNYNDLFHDNMWSFRGIDVHTDEYSDDIVVGKSLGLDLEGDSVDIDNLIKDLQEVKAKAEELGLKGKVRLHCGVTYG